MDKDFKLTQLLPTEEDYNNLLFGKFSHKTALAIANKYKQNNNIDFIHDLAVELEAAFMEGFVRGEEMNVLKPEISLTNPESISFLPKLLTDRILENAIEAAEKYQMEKICRKPEDEELN